jgi:hypothetical protein
MDVASNTKIFIKQTLISKEKEKFIFVVIDRLHEDIIEHFRISVNYAF